MKRYKLRGRWFAGYKNAHKEAAILAAEHRRAGERVLAVLVGHAPPFLGRDMFNERLLEVASIGVDR